MHQLNLNSPQAGLLLRLSNFGVRFLIIGGHAVRAHGFIRPTHDLDIWVSNSRSNAKKVGKAFAKYNAKAPVGGSWEAAFTRSTARYAYPDEGAGKQADILTSIDGMEFDGCYGRAIMASFGATNFFVLGYSDLIQSKEISAASGNDAVAHQRDLSDIAALKAANEPKPA